MKIFVIRADIDWEAQGGQIGKAPGRRTNK
jgi:hypothetical protein